MKRQQLGKESKVLLANWEKLRGKHVLVVGEKIFSAKTGEKALSILKKLEKENPKISPLLTYVPKKETLILWI